MACFGLVPGNGRGVRPMGTLAFLALLLFTWGWHARPAAAVPIPLFCVTNSNAADCAIGEAQILMEVLDASDVGGPKTRFLFTVSGPSTMTIARVYFDDGFLLGPTIEDNPAGGVDFALAFPGPGNLPGGELLAPPFVADQEFNSGAVSPAPSTGVEPGESLGLVFELLPADTTDDVLDWLQSGELRVGLHVINFDSGGSESFVNEPVPEPGSLGLLCLSIGGLALLRRRRGER